METKYIAVLKTLQRAQRFLDVHRGALGDTSGWGARQTLDACVTKLASHAGVQARAMQDVSSEARTKIALRDNLLIKHMRPVAKIAAGKREQIPDRIALRLLPRETKPRLAVPAAYAMADAAQPYARVFLREGLDPGFLVCMRAAADALDSAITNQMTSAATRSVTTRAIRTAASEGRAALQVLSAIVESMIAHDAPLHAQWKTTKCYGGDHA